jgi:hypothetical protein
MRSKIKLRIPLLLTSGQSSIKKWNAARQGLDVPVQQIFNYYHYYSTPVALDKIVQPGSWPQLPISEKIVWPLLASTIDISLQAIRKSWQNQTRTLTFLHNIWCKNYHNLFQMRNTLGPRAYLLDLTLFFSIPFNDFADYEFWYWILGSSYSENNGFEILIQNGSFLLFISFSFSSSLFFAPSI